MVMVMFQLVGALQNMVFALHLDVQDDMILKEEPFMSAVVALIIVTQEVLHQNQQYPYFLVL